MPEPLFILCPPRSFSSIVCGILGQHPQCYGLPELNLFLAEDLRSLWHGPMSMPIFRDGLLRALAELHDGEQTEDTIMRARAWISAHFEWDVPRLLAHIQELVGPKILVEKSPSTVSRPDYMARLRTLYPNANILHLTRHPLSNGESIVALRDRFEALQAVARGPSSDPERMWTRAHELILHGTADCELGQAMRMQGEALLSDLACYLPQICEWLDIDTSPAAFEAMMHPEASPYATPGPRGAPRGNDPNFLQNPAIDPQRLARIRVPSLDDALPWASGEHFNERTRSLAMRFGYS
ncbi:sulfotransferase [Acuticoccus sp. I52.16.1]|uniref:sulfotransferase family protein n=1 Tax=Acuticoccus sp. I52.16.1 TaxID=2928472 RepID=UPI001FD26CE1|nr:sulfotransferase [Acuticoccus sp. I52.16.1]UOM35544.1 sulfotransferase [Acuticoccus sp. I52.16.1]